MQTLRFIVFLISFATLLFCLCMAVWSLCVGYWLTCLTTGAMSIPWTLISLLWLGRWTLHSRLPGNVLKGLEERGMSQRHERET